MKDIIELTEKYQQYNNGTISLGSLIVTILIVIGMWRIFSKAGKGGWKSIIPIYNFYVYCQIVKLNFWLFVIALVCLIVPVVNIISIIYLLYFMFAMNFRLSRAFGHGFWFGLGLCLFDPLFILILGFNGDKYQPNRI